MQKVLTAAQMREVDRLTTERYGIPSIILMENAAHAVARVIAEKLGGSVKGKSILILCGKGNNGGDGAALARVLSIQGAKVYAVLNGERAGAKGDALANFEIAARIHGSSAVDLAWIETIDTAAFCSEVTGAIDTDCELDIVVDALFGSGLDRPLDDALTSCLDIIWTYLGYREPFPPIISIDVPSGLNADVANAVGINVRAAMTVSFTAPKFANVFPPAANYNGELFVEPIGTPDELIDEQPSQLFVAERSDVAMWMLWSRFSDASYKNKRGHALVIAGSESYSGAAVLAGNSAIRSGVGLVTLACPAEAKTEIASRILPEVILSTIGSPEFDELAPKANAIAVGPGLSTTAPEIESLVRKIVEERTTPVIVDAGALWFFNPPAGLLQKPARSKGMGPLVLTPHEGEFMRLLGTDDKDAIKDRVAAVREFAASNNVILVLKGERVLIGHPDGRVVVNPTGNSGLGKAGNGDTLTGILAGFCAQAAAMDIDIFETVVAAVYIAGLAGDIAEKKYGKRVMTASDVRECLADAFVEIEK